MKSINLVFTLFLLVIISCDDGDNYTLASLSEGTTYYTNGKALQKILGRIDIELVLLTDNDLGSYENCLMLQNDQADFAIAQNDINVIPFLENGNSINELKIRTVLPLYPEVLYVLHADSINPTSLQNLVTGRRIGLGPKNSGTSLFFQRLLKHYRIPESSYEIIHTPWKYNVVSDSIDISVAIAGLYSAHVRKQLNRNINMFSFSETEAFGMGSEVEGFCANYTSAYPYLIPKTVFGAKPKKPIVTLAVDAVLLCRKDVEEDEVRAIVRELITQKKILSEYDPLLNALSDQFDKNKLSFPLHAGTKLYLKRNEPTIFERYAELFGVIFSIFIALIGLGSTLVKISNNRKKARIDKFYSALLRIENETDFSSGESINEAIKEVYEIKQKALKLLIKEKLEANASFSIFINLSDKLTEKLVAANDD